MNISIRWDDKIIRKEEKRRFPLSVAPEGTKIAEKKYYNLTAAEVKNDSIKN